MKNSIKPHFKVVYYTNNPETGYFTKTVKQAEKTSVMRLPYQLKVEKTQLTQIKCNAQRIIRGKEKYKSNSNNFKFFTGLQETQFKDWFLGNDYEFILGKKVLSLVLFHFSNENDYLNVYYFSRYYIKQISKRQEFINVIVPQIKNKNIKKGGN
jgi:hypothetical protein